MGKCCDFLLDWAWSVQFGCWSEVGFVRRAVIVRFLQRLKGWVYGLWDVDRGEVCYWM